MFGINFRKKGYISIESLINKQLFFNALKTLKVEVY